MCMDSVHSWTRALCVYQVQMAQAMGPEYLDGLALRALDAGVAAGAPLLWEWLPAEGREAMQQRAKVAARATVEGILADVLQVSTCVRA